MTSDPFHADPLSVPPPPRRRWLRLAVLAVGLASLGAVGGYIYQQLTAPDGGDEPEVPLILADDGPIKKRPDDPGGMAIPNQDKLIYESLRDTAEEEKADVVLPPPEEPLPAPAPIEPAEPAPVAEAPPTPEPMTEAAATEPEPEPEPEAPPAMPEPATAPATATASIAPAAAANRFMVQLGAYRKSAAADAALRGLLKDNRDLLADLEPKVVRADLGSKGVFYRVRAGPVGGAAEARALCDRFKARRQACFIISP